MSVDLRKLWEGCIWDFVIFYSNIIRARICVRFKAYQRVKFEVPESTNCKLLYLRMYLELGENGDHFPIHFLMNFQSI